MKVRDVVTLRPGDPETGLRPDPDRFLEGGLKAASLAAAVLDVGEVRNGRDNRFWAHRNGVWQADNGVVERRVVKLLGEKYRNSHSANVATVVRHTVGTIDCEPVPEVINFRDGLYYWQKNEFRPHDPEVLSTVQMGTDWEPDATCPQFDRFLAEVLDPDATQTVWELLAYLMFSGNPFHKAVLLTGTGRNGKGTLLRVAHALLGGKDNVSAVPLHQLTGQTDKFASAQLFGKIANIAGDIDPTYMESTAMFKSITGEDWITGEHKNMQKFDFRSWAVPVFSANAIPPTADMSVGYMERWLVINFPNSFADNPDTGLTDRLLTELPGIAARAVRALPELMARGQFTETDSVLAAKKQFRRKSNQVQAWLDDCTERHEGNRQNRAEVHRMYERWARREGHEKPLGASKFYERLEAAGVRLAMVHGQRCVCDLVVTDDGSESAHRDSTRTSPEGLPGVSDWGADEGAVRW